MKVEAPYYPIVYVRGYAGSQAEVEETVADPYMGFNLGSTKLRQLWTGDISRHIFESPLVRLMKDYKYTDCYRDGEEIPPSPEPAPARSVWIYRYYEPVSKDLGTGIRPEIEDYANGLADFLKLVRDRVCGNDQEACQAFKVYLVAHSMGGLVVRCYLQNIVKSISDPIAVDKVFTYATPHGGIDFRLIGNVPRFLQFNNVDNFNEGRIREYLKITNDSIPVHSLNGAFPPERFFCLVGTNSRDYTAGGGLSSALVGPLSDGLVQIKNAAVQNAPRAFVHRSHSGHYGIVNSEQGYQNMTRFLFGDVCINGFLDLDEISLPAKVAKAKEEGKKIRASYHIEVISRLKGVRWDLHRRTTNEESAIFKPYDYMIKDSKPVHLFSTYLSKAQIRKKGSRYMGYSVDLRVLVPEYEIDGFLFLNEHIDGGYLFRDKLNIEISLQNSAPATLRYGWDSKTPNRATRFVTPQTSPSGDAEYRIPVRQNSKPGLSGQLVIKAAPWR